MDKELGGTWSYKGKKYTFQREVKLKHPVTRKWVVAIHYVAWEGMVDYVREKEDFLSKFERYYPEEI